MIKPVNWTPDKELEFLLKGGKLTWHIQEVGLKELNFEESRKRQSRLDRQLNENNVLSCSLSMERGVPIPMVCVTKVRGVGLVILAGLHRIAGCQLYTDNRDHNFKIKVYQITDGDQRYIHELLPPMTNALGGQGLDFDQRLVHGVSAVNGGMPVADAATLFGVRTTTLENHVSCCQLREQLIGLGIQPQRSLAKSSCLEKLRGLTSNDNILRAVATTLSEYDLTAEEVRRLVRDVKKQRTEGAALQTVGQHLNDFKKRQLPDRSMYKRAPRRASFLHGLTEVRNNILEHKTLLGLQFTMIDDQQDVLNKIAEVIVLLKRLETSAATAATG